MKMKTDFIMGVCGILAKVQTDLHTERLLREEVNTMPHAPQPAIEMLY